VRLSDAISASIDQSTRAPVTKPLPPKPEVTTPALSNETTPARPAVVTSVPAAAAPPTTPPVQAKPQQPVSPTVSATVAIPAQHIPPMPRPPVEAERPQEGDQKP